MAAITSADFNALPDTGATILDWTWDDYQPYVDDLLARELNDATVDQWLRDSSRIGDLMSEQGTRLRNIYSHDTRDASALKRLEAFQRNIMPSAQVASQRFKERLLESWLTPPGMEYPLRKMRAEAERFRDENVALLTDEQDLVNEYNKITGALSAQFEDRPVTISQLRAVLNEPQRERRESAWRLIGSTYGGVRDKLNDLWTRMFELRGKIASNADCANYTEYLWPLKHRFDYSPADCVRYHEAVEQAVVPALRRAHERRAKGLDVDSLRPWDLSCDPLARAALKPFNDVDALESTCADIFNRLDPQLGAWFGKLRGSQLDLANQPGKAPGGWCSDYPVIKLPHIFMNAVGSHDDVQTLLHEAGHAFHGLATYDLPYGQQRRAYMEFNEVASMAMELLAAPYLTKEQGGFYSEADAARALADHLEHVLHLWCMIAVGDAMQHWAYANPAQGRDAAQIAAKYAELWRRFFPAVDYGGLEDELAWQWQRTLHFYVVPHYYIEYGLALLGATQVWINAQQDQSSALNQYKAALALGGTATLPELYETAGAKLAFDAESYGKSVAAIEAKLEELASAA